MNEARKKAEDAIAQKVGFYVECINPNDDIKIYRPRYLDIGIEGYLDGNTVKLWELAVQREMRRNEIAEIYDELVDYALELRVQFGWKRNSTEKNNREMERLDEVCDKAVKLREHFAKGE